MKKKQGSQIGAICGLVAGAWLRPIAGDFTVLVMIAVFFFVRFLVNRSSGSIDESTGAQPDTKGHQTGITSEVITSSRDVVKPETYEIEELLVGVACPKCSEPFFEYVGGSDGENYIRCTNCYACWSLKELCETNPTFIIAALRECYEGEDFRLSRVILREALDCRTYWAEAMSEYFTQYRRSAGVNYPNGDRPNPAKLPDYFMKVLSDSNAVPQKDAAVQLDVLELLLDIYASIEENCITSLRSYLRRAVESAGANGFLLMPLNDIDSCLEPFEAADSKFSANSEAFKCKLASGFSETGYGRRLSYLELLYGALFPASGQTGSHVLEKPF